MTSDVLAGSAEPLGADLAIDGTDVGFHGALRAPAEHPGSIAGALSSAIDSLQPGGYLALLEGAGTEILDSTEPKGKASLVVFFQDAIEGISASGGCVFHLFIFFPNSLTERLFSSGAPRIMVKAATQAAKLSRGLDYMRGAFRFKLPASYFPFPHALEAVTGQRFTLGSLLEAGSRIFDLERSLNLREGSGPEEDTLAKRFVSSSDPGIEGKDVPLDKMLPAYYRARGWSPDGRPRTRTQS